MRNVNLAILAACAAAALSIGAANAEEASISTCGSMATQVKTALAGAQQSASYQDAVKEQRYGRDFCNNGLPRNGVQHYAQALKLLGEKS